MNVLMLPLETNCLEDPTARGYYREKIRQREDRSTYERQFEPRMKDRYLDRYLSVCNCDFMYMCLCTSCGWNHQKNL